MKKSKTLSLLNHKLKISLKKINQKSSQKLKINNATRRSVGNRKDVNSLIRNKIIRGRKSIRKNLPPRTERLR